LEKETTRLIHRAGICTTNKRYRQSCSFFSLAPSERESISARNHPPHRHQAECAMPPAGIVIARERERERERERIAVDEI